MKVSTLENGAIKMEEVYSGLVLVTNDGEELFIAMRDSGFEMSYRTKGQKDYKTICAKNGIVKDKNF